MSRPVFDPEVQALLEEIVADPDSTLLCVPEAPLSKWLAKREPAVTAGEALLARNERHLMQEHREEAAVLLALACQSALLSRPIAESRIHRHVTGGVHLEPAPLAGLSARAERLANLERGEPHRPALEDLSRSPTSLAAASLRLVPRDETRIWLAIALALEGEPRSAIHVLRDVLAHRPTASNEIYARDECGAIEFRQARYDEALQWYSSAAALSGAGCISLTGWIASAFQAGNSAELKRASQQRDRLEKEDDPSFVESLLFLSSVRASPACLEALRTLQPGIHPTVQRIGHALE